MSEAEPMTITNLDPNKVAEALAAFTTDIGVVGQKMNEVKKARKTTKDHQTYYEQEHGIPASAIRDRYEELQMSPRERERKYLMEQVTRRAVNLWDAESPEDFEELMAAAVQTEAATGDSARKLAGARAYTDGYNSGMNGGSAITDNPYVPGTFEHQQWSLGCADALGEEQREAPRMGGKRQETAGNAARPADAPKRGRPRKKSASELLSENAEKLGGEADVPVRLFEDDPEAEVDLPATPALPEG